MAEQIQQYTEKSSPYLNDVPQDQRFILSNGLSMSNLEGLFHILSNSDDPLFYTYVNEQKNDFASWIRACIKHEELANKLSTCKQKQPFMDVLGKEIELLKYPGLEETAKFFQEDMGETKKPAEPAKSTPAVEHNVTETAPVDAPSSKPQAIPETNSQISPNAQPEIPSTVVEKEKPPSILLDFEKFLAPLILELEAEMLI